jgi:hypothetical protein
VENNAVETLSLIKQLKKNTLKTGLEEEEEIPGAV